MLPCSLKMGRHNLLLPRKVLARSIFALLPLFHVLHLQTLSTSRLKRSKNFAPVCHSRLPPCAIDRTFIVLFSLPFLHIKFRFFALALSLLSFRFLLIMHSSIFLRPPPRPVQQILIFSPFARVCVRCAVVSSKKEPKPNFSRHLSKLH